MDTTPNPGTRLSHKQVIILAAVCWLVGIPVGYLLRAPSTGAAEVAQNVPQSPTPAAMGNPSQVSPAQLKHMADVQSEALQAELKQHPNDPAILSKIGDTYLAARQFESAEQYYERSLAVKQDAAVLTQLASAHYYLGGADKAIATLERALKVDPTHANALYNLGMLEWRVKSDPQSAVDLWERLLKAHPDDPNRAQVEQMISKAKIHLNLPPNAKTTKPAL